jgi:CheY-like chemotaxis protein
MEIFKHLDLVNQALRDTKDLEHIIEDVLEAVFLIFRCDRVWLFHPCDPDAATIRVLAEKNRPEYPGAFTTGAEIPISPEAAETIRKALHSSSPVVFGPGTEITEVFSLDKETLKSWLLRFADVSKTGESVTFEGYLTSTAIWYTASVSRPDPDHLITVFENITERKEAIERVFFVDDEEMLIRLNETMLEALGYKVTTSSSSVEALRIFPENPEIRVLTLRYPPPPFFI